MSNISETTILYLSKHFRKKITLEELAKNAGFSAFHFHRKFVEENDFTPQNYLEKIRMQHATHLMGLYPNWALTDIAFECGYSSPGIFSRAFKKYFGVAPSQYEQKEIAMPENFKVEQEKPFQIQYISKKKIAVKKVPLIEKELSLAYQTLIDSAHSNLTIIGFYLDAPFHIPQEQCRYFIGIESEFSDKGDSVLTIDSGYYTTVIVKGGFDNLEEKMLALNQQIQRKGYIIDSLTGFEKVNITKPQTQFDYLEAAREIFVKIKRE